MEMPIIGEQCNTHTTDSKVEERLEGASSSTGGDLIQNRLEYRQSRMVSDLYLWKKWYWRTHTTDSKVDMVEDSLQGATSSTGGELIPNDPEYEQSGMVADWYFFEKWYCQVICALFGNEVTTCGTTSHGILWVPSALFGNELSACSTTSHEILRVLCDLLGYEITPCDTTSGTICGVTGPSWIKITVIT